jgi:transposase
MRKRVELRELTTKEQAEIKQLARSRTAAARMVERAKIIWQASQGRPVAEIAQRVKVHESSVGRWLKRFNRLGMGGLADAPRSGRPATYTPEQVAEVIATALTDPQALDRPFASWTLDRLEAYLNEQRGLAIKRSRIDEILQAEGLRWRQQEKWFGARVDPDFAAKRGRLSGSTPRRRKAA